MSETLRTSNCERGNDLITFLYGEATEHESRDFEGHLQVCGVCRAEMAAFGDVRESIGLWKEEAFTAFVPRQITTERKKSAVAALREFFNLSPLWLKGAVGFAGVLFCALLFLIVTLTQRQPSIIVQHSDAQYTESDLMQALQRQALELQAMQTVQKEQTPSASVPEKGKTVRRQVQKTQPSEWAKSRKPLSKAEREQLAADLRLITVKDEESLNLLGDRINQE